MGKLTHGGKSGTPRKVSVSSERLMLGKELPWCKCPKRRAEILQRISELDKVT